MSNKRILFIRRNWVPLAIIILGLTTRFAFIWWPNEVVFDEVHSGKLVASYFTGEYIFDIHPPLGKLLMALALWFADFNPGFDFDHIGEPYGSVPYIAFRFFPNLFGGLLPFAIWWLARELKFSKLAAFSAGALLILDGALITHSHFAMLDAFMLFFGFAGLAAFIHARKKNYDLNWLALSGTLFGFSISSKWTGIAFLATSGVLFVIDIALGLIKDRNIFTRPKVYLPVAKTLGALIILPFLVYILTFAVHFNLLTKPGPGSAFMSQNFLDKSFYGKFLELNRVMYTANAGNLTPHPYSSKPYTWPLVLRSIYYWAKDAKGSVARIYLIGNPAVWWGSTFFGLLAVIFWWSRPNLELVCLWLIAFLPFLPVQRSTFLYHYFTSLIAAVMLATGWLGDEPRKRVKMFALGLILAAALILFVYFAPLTYGLYLTESAFKSRLWLPGWL